VRGNVRLAVWLSYAGFVFVGINSGATGVLLLAQIRDYGVDRAIIGLTFFTSAIGFMLASLATGPLLHRFGYRISVSTGGAAFVLAGLYLAIRPPFAVFVLVQLVTGYAAGIYESVLNAYVVELPNPTTLINRLHAFFGVGALIGPALAAWIVGFGSWRTVYLVLALACVLLAAGFAVLYPGTPAIEAHPGKPVPSEPLPAEPLPAEPRLAEPLPAQAPRPGVPAAAESGGLLGGALRERGVLLGASMLAVYVGVELSVGGWSFSYLVQSRSLSQPLAGYLVSGYWLGLTLGRFLISPLATRFGVAPIRMMYGCLTGILACATLVWLVPGTALVGVALCLLGFFLGPVFPTTMSLAPQMTSVRLQSTAIGVMNAASTVGGSALPWLAGAIGQSAGVWTLLPYAMTLAALQFVVWRPLATWIRRASGTEAS
jgi:fucose permease